MSICRVKRKTKNGSNGGTIRQGTMDGSSHMRGMSPTSRGQLSSFYSSSPVLSLKPIVQPKLTIGKPNDKYEREADRVADQVMRMPEPKGSLVQRQSTCPECPDKKEIQTKPVAEHITPLVQRQEEVPEEEEGEEESPSIQAKGNMGRIPKVSPTIASGIKSLKDGGQPLPKSIRNYFEPRFGLDFSQVRVHTGTKAAETAKSVNAKAFTTGKDVVFGTGQYSPHTPAGKHLLAHELTHVVQQSNNIQTYQGADRSSASPSIMLPGLIGDKSGNLILQRARITHKNLTWGDFKGAVPKGATLDAFTFSDIGRFGKWSAKKKVINTKKPCNLGKTKSKVFKVKVFFDPGLFDGVKGFMTQEKSWVKKSFVKVNTHCKKKTKECEGHFAKEFIKIKKICRKHVSDCQKSFDNGYTTYELKFDGVKVTVRSKSECSTTLLKKCRELSKKGVSYSLANKRRKKKLAEAKNKKQCKGKSFVDKCKKFYNDVKSKVLKHEQGHFDIAHVIAQKTQKALKDKAKKMAVEKTGCGNSQTQKAAFEAFNKRKPGDAINKIFSKGKSTKKTAEEDYDNDTNHGLKEVKQKAWEKKILAKLPSYKL